jgi:hypothetical protein
MSENKKVKKEVQAIDPEDVSEVIDAIVAFMGAVESSREEINKRVKYLKDSYGLSSSAVRAVATVIHKQNEEQLSEKETQIKNLLSICKG